MERFVSDFVYALRALRRRPGFTAVAIVSLALGIGANTAIFTLVDNVLLRSLPVREPERLAMLTDPDNRGQGSRYCYRFYTELQRRNAVFSGLLARADWGHDMEFLVSVDGRGVERATGELDSGSFFRVLGGNAYLGRVFAEDDDRPPGNPVAVISYAYWRSRFGADPAVIGRALQIRRHAFTIIGVTPPGFFGIEVGAAPAIRIPLTTATTLWPPDRNSKSNDNYLDDPSLSMNHTDYLQLVGRLKPGVSVQQAEAALEGVNRQIRLEESASPNWARTPMNRSDVARFLSRRIAVSSAARGFSWLRAAFLAPLLALMAVVAAVLLIACSTLANLLLARGVFRQREFAVRLALGAGRIRIARQLLIESVLLSGAGGVLGVLVARWGARALIAAAPGGAPDLALGPDVRVLGFACGMALLTGALFGLAPVFQAVQTEVMDTLKAQGGALAGHGGRLSLRKGLIVLQVALSVLLLIGAGLFVRTLRSLRDQDTGLELARVLQMYVQPYPYSGAPGPETRQLRARYYERLFDRIRSLPGVKSAAGSRALLLGDDWFNWPIRVPGRETVRVSTNVVTSTFFETLGVPLVAGRAWAPSDDFRPVEEAIVSESFARDMFGGASPIGRTLSTWTDRPYTIVGIAKDSRHPNNLRLDQPRAVYLSPWGLIGSLSIYVRTAGDPGPLIGAVRREALSLSPEAQVTETGTLEGQVDRLLSNERLVAQLSSVFGLLATVLAAIGLYGVIAFSVARRTREIGLRLALGAGRAGLYWLVLRVVLALAAAGAAVGVLAAVALTRLVKSLLFGVAPNDPATVVGVVLLMGATALLAAWLPARRAARVDPMAALRSE